MDESFLKKRISSNPGAEKFRSIVAIIFIVVAIALFWSFTSDLTRQANKIAHDRVIIDINHSLAMMLYDYTVKGQQKDLAVFHKVNPFIPLGIYRQLPPNYIGTQYTQNVQGENQWFFDTQKKQLGILIEGKFEYWSVEYKKSGQIYRLVLEKR